MIIVQGKGMMTGFPQLKDDEKEALMLSFLWGQEVKRNVVEKEGEKGLRSTRQ